MKRILIIFVASMFLLPQAWAQTSSKKYASAETILEKGIDLYDSGKYEAALKEFQKINANDSIYPTALYEMALAYNALGKYDEAIEKLNMSATYPYALTFTHYVLLGSTLDDAGRIDESLAIFEEIYPNYSHLHTVGYNYAVTLYRAGKLDEAEKIIERAIRINPTHFRSHMVLGTIHYAKGRLVPALLCFSMASNMGSSSQAYDAMEYFENALNGELTATIESDSKAKVTEASPSDPLHIQFNELETLIRSNFATNKKFVYKSKLDFYVLRQTQFMIENLTLDSKATNLINQLYVPYYMELNKQGYMEAYLVYSLRFSNRKEVQKEFKKQNQKLTKYVDFAINNIVKGRETLFDPSGNKYYTFSKSGIETMGSYSDKTKNLKTGEWIEYYSNGPISSVEHYKNNNLDGEFVYYNYFGGIKQKGTYKNGKISGDILSYHTNGLLAEKFTYADGEVVDTGHVYNFSGNLESKTVYINGKRNGPRITYYNNGNKRLVSNFVNNLLEGKYEYYSPNKKLYYDCNIVNEDIQGPLKTYYANGKLSELQTYVNDEFEGEQKEWYPNGQLKSSYNIKNGNISGLYRAYYSTGVLSDSVYYNEKGEIIGTLYNFDVDGKLHYTGIYKSGKLTAYNYFDKNGKQIQSVPYAKDTRIKSYYPNGQMLRSGEIKNYEMDGPYYIYDSQGRVEIKCNYSEGKLHSDYIDYYSNGNTYLTCTYNKGKREGYYARYFKDGSVSIEGYYQNDNKVGEWKEYYNNGIVSRSYYLGNEGQLQGWDIDYTTEGKLSTKKQYDNGCLLKYIKYGQEEKVMDSCELKNGNGTLELKHPDGKTYYKVNTILGGKYEGIVTRYSVNGTVIMKGNYCNDERDGLFVWYTDNKTKISEETYILGKKHGTSRNYYRTSGKLHSEIEYELGDMKKETYYYENGSKASELLYDAKNNKTKTDHYAEDGTLTYTLLFENDMLAGYRCLDESGKQIEKKLDKNKDVLVAYYHNGTKAVEMPYINGMLNGMGKKWHTNGTLSFECIYMDGNYNGDCKSYATNGTLTYESTYIKGNRNGLVKSYTANGKLIYEETYVYDILQGTCKYYDKNGVLEYTREYYDSLLVKETKNTKKK